VVLGEGVVGVERQVPVDLARGDVVETPHPGVAGGLEHGLGPEHVGPEEPTGVDHGQAVVGLRREMDDRVDLVRAQGLQGELSIADIAVDEADPVFEIDEVGPVPRVGEGVIGHPRCRRGGAPPSNGRNWTPIKPAPPVTSTFMVGQS